MKRHSIAPILTVALTLSVSAWAADDETKPGAGRQRDPAAAFQRLDADRNGQLNKDEFKKLATFGQGKYKDQPEVFDRICERLDADRSGAMLAGEFKALTELRGRGKPPTPAPAPQKSAAGKPVAPSEENYKKAADYAANSGGRAVLVMFDGKVVFERYDNGHAAAQATHLHSATKRVSGAPLSPP
ncbi:MAG TPA: hypothetical protein VMY37_26515 [Thermoguttaceae bacterium]|nr:hypothetical protein [Thermoguttaceae bacterium]